MINLKFASFNVENLFDRPKVFNFKDHADGDDILRKVASLQDILKESNYTETRKRNIVSLYNELKEFIEIREDRGKLFKKRGWAVVGVEASGAGEWDGAIEFKKAKFSEMARENTAKVIKSVNADIACIIEADNRIAMKDFDSNLLNYMYKHEMLIDGNDTRGIDVGLLSKYPLGSMYTHIYDKSGANTVFSRDCLEIEVKISVNRSLYVLCNHFKSKGYDADGSANTKRKRQATRVAEILSSYNLNTDFVIVAGDLNDTPDSDPLSPLLSKNNLFDVLKLAYPDDPNKRWTYHYRKFEQIDYILISKALKEYFLDAGVERRGMYDLHNLTSESNGAVDVEDQFETVTHWTNAASDHGAVWAKFKVPTT